MITQDMKRRLRDRGYTNDDIAHLAPKQAHDILATPENGWRVERVRSFAVSTSVDDQASICA